MPTLAALALALVTAGNVPPAPRVALLYSDYGNYRHRDNYDAAMATLAWPMEKVENTAWDDLTARLGEFDLILGTALYNLSHPQDFSRRWDQLVAWLRNGGAMVLTDTNYNEHLAWLKGLGDGYEGSIERCDNQGQPAVILEPQNPLLTWPNAWLPTQMWAHMKLGLKWRVLARCDDDAAILAVAEVGRGFIWLSSNWPLPERALRNIWDTLRMRRAGVELRAAEGLTDLHPGRCTATLRLRAAGDEAVRTAVSWCVQPAGGEVLRATREVTLQPGAEVKVELPATLVGRGELHTWLEFGDPEQGGYRSEPAAVRVPERVEVDLLQPAYRGLIALGLPHPAARLRLTCYPFDEDFHGAELHLLATQAGATLAEDRAPAPAAPGEAVEVELNLAGAKTGEVALTAALRRGDNDLWTWHQALLVIDRAERQVLLGDQLETWVDGRPFFPIGVYHIAPQHFAQAKAMGFNCVQLWGGGVDQARTNLDAAQQAGFKVILEMSNLLRDKYQLEPFRDVVRAVKDHPALLVWYPVDEPIGGLLPWCQDAYRICREEDPNHPVYLVMCVPSAFHEFAQATDILAIDPYPIPGTSTAMVGGWMGQAGQATEGRQAVWLIPQLHNPAAYGGGTGGRAPTPDEEWCMVAQGLIGGAKGIVYYPWDDGKTGVIYEPALLAELPKINAFLLQYGTELAASQLTPVEGLPDGLQATVFTGRRTLLLATCTGDQPMVLRLPVAAPVTAAQSLRDDRAWAAKDGRVEIGVKPLEVVAAELR